MKKKYPNIKIHPHVRSFIKDTVLSETSHIGCSSTTAWKEELFFFIVERIIKCKPQNQKDLEVVVNQAIADMRKDWIDTLFDVMKESIKSIPLDLLVKNEED